MAVDAQGNPIPDPSAPAATGGSGLGDLLAGIGGANINRPAMGASIANGQAIASLRTAQTENALLTAQQARDEADARVQGTSDRREEGPWAHQTIAPHHG